MDNSPLSQSNVSQRGLLSIAMLLFSVGSLTIALLAGAKLVYDIFEVGLINSLDGLATKAIVVGIAYLAGWLTAILAIRVYGNLVLPFIINLYIWVILIAVCTLYLLILQRLYDQQYDMLRYAAYVVIMASALGAMVGLHLVLEGHSLRPLSVPLLLINLLQLGLIVFRYVFTPDAQSAYLLYDLFFFGGMAVFSVFMLAHIGLLSPVRTRVTTTFDRNSQVIIRTEE
jgi:hypothetical protein